MDLALVRRAYPDLSIEQLRRRGFLKGAATRLPDGSGFAVGIVGKKHAEPDADDFDGAPDFDEDDIEKADVTGLRDWVGRVGFDEAVKHIATKKDRKTGKPFGEDRAKRIAGKLKGQANRAGTLAPEHSYDPKVREMAKASIGKTRTRKPVGAGDGQALSALGYAEHFTPADHLDAAELHDYEASRHGAIALSLRRQAMVKSAVQSRTAIDQHVHRSRLHEFYAAVHRVAGQSADPRERDMVKAVTAAHRLDGDCPSCRVMLKASTLGGSRA